ncbi:MAG: VWA domain-containing protein [Prevotella sp.]|nr:VWA domain-containing protein [Prevotella sp.]
MMEQYFEDPQYLWLLLLIPLLVAVYVLTQLRQRKRLRRFGDPELVRQLMPDVSRWRPVIKFSLLLIAFMFLIIAFARPHIGIGTKTEKRTGIETIIAVDVSNSMRAKDVSPSRLDRSKMMIENMVDKFSNDKIGLIVFAGDAFVQLPMTSDYVSAKMFLSSIDPSMIATQGTDIAEAIDMASHCFSQEEAVGKAIIVITDGEDHEGGAVEAAEDAKKRGMRVYVLGVGSTNGSPVPDPSTGRFMTDNAGNTVMSALNETMCKQIAQAGGGAYIHVENGYAAQEQLNAELDKLAKKEVSVEVYNAYEERFIEFALIALLFVVLEVLLLERKSPLFRNVHLFRRKKAVMLLLLMGVAATAFAQADRHYVRQGNALYRRGAYADAEVKYRKALEENKDNPQAIYNLGNALLRQQKDSAAIEQFQLAAKIEKNPLRKYQSYHNIGVVCQGHRMFKEAIEAYKEALRLNPNDDETRYNLEVCKRQLKRQQQGGGGNNDQNKDQKDDQNKDKKDDQNKDNQNKDKKNDEDKKDSKDDQQKKNDQQNKDNQQDQQQDQKPRMSKENAEQLLNAAIQKERQTQQRMQEQQQRQQNRRRLQKNW